jgi:hypothetical protein
VRERIGRCAGARLNATRQRLAREVPAWEQRCSTA